MATDPAALLDFEEYLKSDELASFYEVLKIRSAIMRTTGSLSTIASVCIIVHILRSHHGLSTTYHRLVVGLSIGDILASFFGYILDGTMAPKEMDYIVPFAIGNRATCNAQGFLLMLGIGIALSYNSSICLYYLAIVTFNKKDDYIRQKLEPWLHGISILVGLASSSAVLAMNGFNSSGGFCWTIPNSLPHCWGLDNGEIRDGFTIPCGRNMLRLATQIFVNGYPAITPVVIIVTMSLMYRSVRKVEKKMQRYGVSALRLRHNARSNHVGSSNTVNATSTSASGCPPPCDDTTGNGNLFFRAFQWLKINYNKIPCTNYCSTTGNPTSRSNTVTSQKRAILHRAAGYVLAWGLSFIPVIVIQAVMNNVPAMFYLYAVFLPLQGVFNFVAYMHPKVVIAKKGPGKTRPSKHGTRNDDHANVISWRQAYVKAYKSRGPKKTSRQHHASRSKRNDRVSLRNRLQGSLMKLVMQMSNNKSMNNSNDRAANTNHQHQQEVSLSEVNLEEGVNIVAIVDAPQRDGNDDETPEPSKLHRDSCEGCLLVLAEDADDLREQGEVEECYLNNSNDEANLNNELGEVNDNFFSEEIQSALE